jgi:hypothetical protein
MVLGGESPLVDLKLGWEFLYFVGLQTTVFADDDVELDVIAFLQAFVSVNLNGTEVAKYIGTIIASDEAVAFPIVEPFHLSKVLRHVVLRSADDQLGVVITRLWSASFDSPPNAVRGIHPSFKRLSSESQEISARSSDIDRGQTVFGGRRPYNIILAACEDPVCRLPDIRE